MDKMNLKKQKISWIYAIWEEGKYIDLWNLPHFLIGVILGFILIFLNVSLNYSLLIVFLIKLTWEIYEHLKVIKEAIPNKILDIVTGILGYLAVFYLNKFRSMGLEEFLIVLTLAILLGAWGFYSAKKLDNFIN